MGDKFRVTDGDMPEEILARPVMGTQPDFGNVHQSGPWALDDPFSNAVKYIRADLVDNVKEET